MPIERQPLRAFIPALTEGFRRFCAEHDLRVLTTATDKYGSLVWEAGLELDGLARYLTLAISEDDIRESERSARILEVWIAADDGRKYLRARVSERPLAVSPTQLGTLVPGILAQGWKQVKTLREQDLSESYLVPRI